MAKIAVVGSANVDLVAQVEKLPAPGETVLAHDFIEAMGGKGANQAVAAARLGAEVTFIARVGSDSYADICLRAYQEAGIDTHSIQRTAGKSTGLAMIGVAESGENSIIVISGANMALSPADVLVHEAAISQADVLLTQLEIPLDTMIVAIEIAHKNGVKVILNPAPYQALPAEILQKVTILTPNQRELAGFLGHIPDNDEQMAKGLLGKGVQGAVITLGKDGALVAGSWGWQRIPAFDVKVTDTTAAGDAFSAALAVALTQNKNLPDAAQLATAAAALCVSRSGAQPSLPYLAEVEEFLKKQPPG